MVLLGIAGLLLCALFLPSFGTRAPGSDWVEFDGERRFDLRPPENLPRPDGVDGGGGGGGRIDLGSLPVELLRSLSGVADDAGNLLLELLELIRLRPRPPDDPPRPPNGTASGYEVRLSDEPVPGRTVTVLVLEDGRPAEGVEVFFNGDSIGTTGERGQVTGTVPYSKKLRITIRPPPGGEPRLRGRSVDTGDRNADRWGTDRDGWHRDRGGTDPGGFRAGAGSAGGGSPERTVATVAAANAEQDPGISRLERSGAAVDRFQPRNAYGGPRRPDGREPAGSGAASGVPPDGGNRTYTIGSVAVRIVGPVEPGAAVTVVTTVDDEPVRGLYVAIDGERVGETDATGRVEVTLPRAERAKLTVSRGSLTASETLKLTNVSVTVQGPLLGALVPGMDATVTVEREGEPLPDSRVRVAGSLAGETGTGGTLGVSVPVRPSVRVTVVTPRGVTVTRRTWPGATVLVGLVVLVAGARFALGVRRRAGEGSRADAAAAILRSWLSRVADAVVGLALRVESLLGAVGAALGRLLRWLRSVLGRGGLAGLLVALWGRLRAAAAALRDPRSLLARLRAWVARRLGLGDATGTDEPPPASSPASATGTTDGADGDGGAIGIREAWRLLLSLIDVGDYRTKTPGELADRAVAAGLPADAVGTLADAFRDIEYGQGPPDRWRDRVREAVEAIRAYEPGSDGGSDQGVGGESGTGSAAGSGVQAPRSGGDAPGGGGE